MSFDLLRSVISSNSHEIDTVSIKMLASHQTNHLKVDCNG
jgi:hypothetical protein